MITRLTKCAAFLCAACVAHAAACGGDSPVPAFKKGDRVCLIGDSITGGAYCGTIILFYVLRFPDARVEFANCGLSGDESGGALRRFDWDIAVHKPTVSTIMFGMNDTHHKDYGEDKGGEEFQARRRKSLDDYASNMDVLARRLTEAGSRVIFITPSMYDQTGSQKVKSLVGVNDALAECGEIERGLAGRYHAAVVDFNGTMTRLNAEWQAKDPDFTLVGPDRVHPGEVGHMVMAYLFLKAQNLSACVASMGVDARKFAVVKSERCAITSVRSEEGGVGFDCHARSLPFPVQEAARKALELVPFVEELDRETLAVDGLDAGRYDVVIDGALVGEWAAEELKGGVNLALNPRTPQHQQAREVKAFLDKQQALTRQLRTAASVWHFTLLEHPDLRPGDEAGAERIIRENLEKAKAAKSVHGQWMLETFLKTRPRQAEIAQEIRQAVDAMWQAAAPRPHHYLIRRKL